MVCKTMSEWILVSVGLRSVGGREPLVRKGDTMDEYLVNKVCFMGRGPGSEVTKGEEQ